MKTMYDKLETEEGLSLSYGKKHKEVTEILVLKTKEIKEGTHG